MPSKKRFRVLILAVLSILLLTTMTVAYGAGDGPDTAEASDVPDVVSGYDRNGNGVIDRPEVLQAIRDYFADAISRDDVLSIIRFYFSGQSVGPSIERESLIALYRATDGPNWTRNDNWLTDAPLGDWHGVTTNDSGRVTRLSLQDNQLSGELPQGLTGLSALEVFYFFNNPNLCAPVDSAFQSWLAGIGRVIGSSCALEDFPADRAVLEQLYRATDGANWTNKDNWLDNSRLLREWRGVTTDAQGRVNGLFLSGNKLTGPIPASLGNLTSLTTLYLNGNQLTGPIPARLGNLNNLQLLWLYNNKLSGAIPTELGSLPNLTWLNLGGNELSGPIPTKLGDLTNLTGLFLWRNQLTGEIPTELGSLTRLTWLDLSNNQLTGTIPNPVGPPDQPERAVSE